MAASTRAWARVETRLHGTEGRQHHQLPRRQKTQCPLALALITHSAAILCVRGTVSASVIVSVALIAPLRPSS
ncbi:hypothetical protein [Acidimangrovimonas sediminis]|uniref:hypothetical protein n=1 Tax=Acidimangrovimonas sediminis TaxID=2056283 RepID=UPI0038BBE101